MVLQNSSEVLEGCLTLAVATAQEAGKLLIKGLGQEAKVEHKSSAVDWVTEYDRASEKLIVEKLLDAYPDFGIVGEEGSRREGEGGYTWYIDPLDGTNNYAHHFPIFAVSIALYQGETPLVGVVYDPLREETFSALLGRGAYLSRGKWKLRLQVSETTDLTSSLIATGFPYDRQISAHNNVAEVAAFLRTALDVRRAGSAALDMVYVAAGRLDGYWEYELFTWDMAAARLIVEEAGGKFTHVNGEPLLLKEKLSIVASNGIVHSQMLEVLNGVKASWGKIDLVESRPTTQ